MSGTRQISFDGLFKKLRHDLQLDDAENGDLIDTDSPDDDAELGTEVVYCSLGLEAQRLLYCEADAGDFQFSSRRYALL